MKKTFFACLLLFSTLTQAQTLKNGKLYLNEDGSRFMKFTLLNQTWFRAFNYNPGTTVFDYSKEKGTDIGIRRYRVQFFGQLTDRVFVYSQFGENNFSHNADRKLGFFVHDAIGEYALDKQKLSIGAGLTAWSGLSRFSAPSVGSFLGIDAPLFLQSTNDVTDQFLRKLSIYAKGKMGKFDYRITIADPMAFQKSSGYSPMIGSQSNFSSKPAKKQWNGYFMYQFMDQESNQTPYMTGTYQGKKKVFNIGAGFVYQPEAMWHQNGTDTISTDMVQLAADIYYDSPVGSKGEAISFYGNYTNFDFGPNYLRNLGAMNPGTGNSNPDILNGAGTNYPAFGTGDVLYVQFGYKFSDNLIGKTTLMPYASIQHANYKKLNDPVDFTDIGLNWILDGHTSKLGFAWQSRPIFNGNGDKLDRKGGLIVQYQVYFN